MDEIGRIGAGVMGEIGAATTGAGAGAIGLTGGAATGDAGRNGGGVLGTTGRAEAVAWVKAIEGWNGLTDCVGCNGTTLGSRGSGAGTDCEGAAGLVEGAVVCAGADPLRGVVVKLTGFCPPNGPAISAGTATCLWDERLGRKAGFKRAKISCKGISTITRSRSPSAVKVPGGDIWRNSPKVIFTTPCPICEMTFSVGMTISAAPTSACRKR